MIAGFVNSQLEANIALTLIGNLGQQIRIEAIIDTGFDGWLILPPDLIAELAITKQGNCDALLADGSESDFGIYSGTVLWDRRRRHIPIHESQSTPLVGMALLEQHELTIQARSGGSVTIRRLPKNT